MIQGSLSLKNLLPLSKETRPPLKKSLDSHYLIISALQVGQIFTPLSEIRLPQ